MSDQPLIIRRGASHETIWKLWSAAQVKRLVGLPSAELLLAVQTGATADLTPDDRGAVLTALAASGYSHGGPAVTAMPPRRKPLSFKGLGLPCKARPLVGRHRIRIGFAVALAVAAWGTTIALGYADLTPPQQSNVP